MLKSSEKSLISSRVFALAIKTSEEAVILMNVLQASFPGRRQGRILNSYPGYGYTAQKRIWIMPQLTLSTI